MERDPCIPTATCLSSGPLPLASHWPVIGPGYGCLGEFTTSCVGRGWFILCSEKLRLSPDETWNKLWLSPSTVFFFFNACLREQVMFFYWQLNEQKNEGKKISPVSQLFTHSGPSWSEEIKIIKHAPSFFWNRLSMQSGGDPLWGPSFHPVMWGRSYSILPCPPLTSVRMRRNHGVPRGMEQDVHNDSHSAIICALEMSSGSWWNQSRFWWEHGKTHSGEKFFSPPGKTHGASLTYSLTQGTQI